MLDPSFGDGGIVKTDFHAEIPTNGYARDMSVVQTDGKIVVAGVADRVSNIVVRYLANGEIDYGFGKDGMVAVGFGNPWYLESVNALALQPDGKIVVAGWTGPSWDDRDFALARFNVDDILIAGCPTYGISAIDGIMQIWTGTGEADTRRLAVLDYMSTNALTVADDTDRDVLTGSSGTDWFFANLDGDGVLDKVTDLDDEAFAMDLDFILAG
jgi:uncharacterized delta-60 repeat protein